MSVFYAQVGHYSSGVTALLCGRFGSAVGDDLGFPFTICEFGFHEDIFELFAL